LFDVETTTTNDLGVGGTKNSHVNSSEISELERIIDRGNNVIKLKAHAALYG
jgi:hypothetical protein